MSKTSAAITLVVSSFGTGILYMPSSFKLLGYGYACLSLAFMGFLTYFTLYALAYAAIMVECKTKASYPKLASLFSSRLKVIIDITLIGSNLGSAACILRYFCSNAATMLGILGVNADYEQMRKASLCFIVVVVAYFGLKESLSSLAFISKISIAGVIYYLGLILYYALKYGHSLRSLDLTSNNYGSGFIKFVFALHCQFSFLDVFSEMEDKSLGGVSAVCAVVSLVIVLVYSASGLLGYIAIGREIGNRHILEVFVDRNTEFMKLVSKDPFSRHAIPTNIALGIFLFVWFGFLNFATAPVITIIQSYLVVKGKPVQRMGISVAIALFFLAAGLPEELNIATVLDVCAAVFTNPLSFAFPAIFMILTTPRFSGKSVLSYLLIGFSVAIMCVILKGVFL